MVLASINALVGRMSSPEWLFPGGLQLAPASPGGFPGSASGSDTGSFHSFQIIASALGLLACEICMSFLSVESLISYSPLASPYVIPSGLQSQMFWGLIFPVQDPQAGELDVGLRPLTPWGEPLQL